MRGQESKHGSDPVCLGPHPFLPRLVQLLKDPELQALFFLVVTMLVSGTLFYRRVEGWNLLDSLCFSVITLTTVGCGDFSPSTTAGNISTMFYIFIRVGIILGYYPTPSSRHSSSGWRLFGILWVSIGCVMIDPRGVLKERSVRGI